MQCGERLFDINRRKAVPSVKANYTRATSRTNSELSPAIARHEKGVSFWEVESIAKGWKPDLV